MLNELRFEIKGVKSNALLSVADVAAGLGYRPQWVYRLIYSGRLRSEIVAGRHVITGRDLVAYIDSRVPFGAVTIADQPGGE